MFIILPIFFALSIAIYIYSFLHFQVCLSSRNIWNISDSESRQPSRTWEFHSQNQFGNSTHNLLAVRQCFATSPSVVSNSCLWLQNLLQPPAEMVEEFELPRSPAASERHRLTVRWEDLEDAVYFPPLCLNGTDDWKDFSSVRASVLSTCPDTRAGGAGGDRGRNLDEQLSALSC